MILILASIGPFWSILIETKVKSHGNSFWELLSSRLHVPPLCTYNVRWLISQWISKGTSISTGAAHTTTYSTVQTIFSWFFKTDGEREPRHRGLKYAGEVSWFPHRIRATSHAEFCVSYAMAMAAATALARPRVRPIDWLTGPLVIYNRVRTFSLSPPTLSQRLWAISWYVSNDPILGNPTWSIFCMIFCQFV